MKNEYYDRSIGGVSHDENYNSLKEYENGIKSSSDDNQNNYYDRSIGMNYNDEYDSLSEYENGIKHFQE